MAKLSDLDIAYKRTFNTEAGDQVIEDLKSRLFHAQTLYSHGMSNEELHFLMGRQSVINDILYTLSKEND